MKPLTIAITTLTASLASSPVSAHIGDHQQQTLLSGLSHLLTEHALPISVIAVLVFVLLIRQRWRA